MKRIAHHLATGQDMISVVELAYLDRLIKSQNV